MAKLKFGSVVPRQRARIPSIVECPKDLARVPVGEVCGATLASLHPTQATVGYLQVYSGARKMAELRRVKLARELLCTPIPVVIGPDREPYVIDHHHHAASLWVMGFEYGVVEVKEKCLDLTEKGFWVHMRRRKYVHLYDEHGRELNDRTQLPACIAGLRDNVYQSVAWATRKAGGYAKSAVAVSDFKWPDFFRARLGPVTAKNFEKAVKRAVRLALSDAARGLPGHIRTRTR